MPIRAAAGVLGVLVTLATLALVPTGPAEPPQALPVSALSTVSTTSTASTAPKPPPAPGAPLKQPTGHLTLIVEGDARSLAITFIATKTDPYNPVRRKSPYEIAVLDATGKELGRYPLDLSRFDVNPLNIGKPDQVTGDEIVSRRVQALTNIPWFTDADRLDIQKNRVSVGQLSAAGYARLLAEARTR